MIEQARELLAAAYEILNDSDEEAHYTLAIEIDRYLQKPVTDEWLAQGVDETQAKLKEVAREAIRTAGYFAARCADLPPEDAQP